MDDNDEFLFSFVEPHNPDGDNVYQNKSDGEDDIEFQDSGQRPKPFNNQETATQIMDESPGGSKYWTPIVDDETSIKLGDTFPTVYAAEMKFRKYGDVAGFDVRLANKKTNKAGRIQNRYFFCSKQGVPDKRDFDSFEVADGEKKKRRSKVKRTGCQASMKIRYVNETGLYEVYRFVDRHNHMLYLPEDRLFARTKRQLGFSERRGVIGAVVAKVGITQSYRMNSHLKGGIDTSGGSARDLLNFKRDVGKFVGNKDAQMLINRLSNRKEYCPEYFFEYKVDGNELVAIFWADETARRNYQEFGDTLSFDATYRTNMLVIPKMISSCW